jgi:radical SAM superfamily enzyme YgiQ (UPF0313 family)
MGLRPDRATDVYCRLIREAYPDTAIIIGGLEASLRRFAQYDYWKDEVIESVLVSSGADILTYGMGENIIRKIASLLNKGVPISKIRDVRGTVWIGNRDDKIHFDYSGGWNFNKLKSTQFDLSVFYVIQYIYLEYIWPK